MLFAFTLVQFSFSSHLQSTLMTDNTPHSPSLMATPTAVAISRTRHYSSSGTNIGTINLDMAPSALARAKAVLLPPSHSILNTSTAPNMVSNSRNAGMIHAIRWLVVRELMTLVRTSDTWAVPHPHSLPPSAAVNTV